MKDNEYTREELTLRPGIKELAKAIIKQWILDGKPEQDRKGIEYWQRILMECRLEGYEN